MLITVHRTLTEHARCLWAASPCDVEDHRESDFVAELTFADAGAILAMLHAVSGNLPVPVRNLAYRLAVLQRPDDPALLREAARSLWFAGRTWDAIADAWERRADALEAAGRRSIGFTEP